MPKFILENFDNQASSIPLNPIKTPFYQVCGVYPNYANKTGNIQEEQNAPMAAAPRFVSQYSTSGNITYMIPSTYPGYSAFACTTNGNVYSVASNYSLGIPSGFGSSAGGRLEVYNGNILASQAGMVSRMDLSTRASWTSISGASVGGLAPMKSFLSSCFVATINSGSLQLNQINPDWSVTSKVLTIGGGWVPIVMENYNNNLLAIAASFSTTTAGISSNYGSSYIFLWNGYSTTYNYSVKVPGLFVDFCCPGNSLYVLHQTAANYYTISVLTTGMVLREVVSFSYNINAVYKICQFDTESLAVLTSAGVLIVDPDEKTTYFLDNILIDNTYTYTSGASGGPNNYFYGAGLTQAGATTTINYFPVLVGGNGYQSIFFNTHYLPAKTPTGQGTIDNIEIYYNQPPVSAGDYIQLTLSTDFSSDPNAPAGAQANNTVTFPNITSTTCNNKYSVIDAQGMMFNKLRLNGSTYSASGWFPNIRKIIINYH